MTERDDSENRLEPYRDWYNRLKEQENSPLGKEINEGIYKFPESEESRYANYQFTINAASFIVSVEKDIPEKFVTVHFPSRLGALSADELYKEVTYVIDSAYPDRRFTPHATLYLQDGREEQLDLSNFWEGRLYEKYVDNPDLKEVVHYLEADFNLPAALPSSGSSKAFFAHGFINEAGIVQEFVRMTHIKASNLDSQFVAELLSRHREYAGSDIETEANKFSGKMKYICDQNPPPKIGF